jgi:phage tail sheath protein FI
MATYNRPGVYLEEVASSVALSSTPTATVATFMGYFTKGPLDATLVSSWSQFTSLYGDILANSTDVDAATAVYLFFANGGSQCYIQRVVVTVAAVSNTATSASTALTIVSAAGLSTSDGGSSGTVTSANAVGATITGFGISSGTLITAVSSTTLTLNKAATVPSGTVLTITTTLAAAVDIKGNASGTLATQTPVGNAAIATQSLPTIPTAGNGSPAGTTNITLVTTTQAFATGQQVTIAGVTPSGYNGTWTVQAGTTSTSLIVNIGSNPGAVTVAGTVAAVQAHITTGTQAYTAGQSVTINGVTPTAYNGTWTVQTGTTSTNLIINTTSNPGAITVAGTVGITGVVTLTTSAAHNLKVGQTVVIAGTAASAQTLTTAYNGTYVVTAVPTTTTFTYSNPAVPVSPITTAGTVTTQSSTTELRLSAKNPGAWTNGLYYDITSSTSSTSYPGKYFNLAIYSGGTSAGYIVERFSDLTLLATESSYAPTIINASSNYVIATDPNAANHTAITFATTNTPLTTSVVSQSAISTTATSASTTVILTTDAAINFGMTVSGNGVTSGTTVSTYVASTKTVTLSAAMTIPASTALTFVNTGLTGGSDGTFATNTVAQNNTAIASTAATAKLDAISQPILLNAAGVTEATNVNALLTYAYNRGDVFVIIDPTQATLDVTSQLTLANSYTGGSAGAAALGFGAVYYPNLTIPNPTSSAQGSIATAYPGGAIAAKYATTDSSRGVFKSPAGLEARLSGVVSVTSLTNNELDYLNNGTANPNTFATATPVNAIRYIPGSGIVVMGARTLSSTYNNRYISVRRSLIYLRKTLTDSTAFALFESNDERLWNRLQTTCEAILINFWQSGGLKGTTALDAFYVKADSSINTVSSIAAGEVHLEIGVALQRPAEFVVIRISQYDSGSVVTVL